MSGQGFLRQCAHCNRVWNERSRTFEPIPQEDLEIIQHAHAIGAVTVSHSYCPPCLDTLRRESGLDEAAPVITETECRLLAELTLRMDDPDFRVSGDGWSLKRVQKWLRGDAVMELVFQIETPTGWQWWETHDTEEVTAHMFECLNGRRWDADTEKWVAA